MLSLSAHPKVAPTDLEGKYVMPHNEKGLATMLLLIEVDQSMRVPDASLWNMHREGQVRQSSRLSTFISKVKPRTLQALQGHGFVHEVDLPTALPRQQPAKEASSSDSGGATWMYPLIGREPSMLQTAQTFQEALLKAHQSGCVAPLHAIVQ